MNDKYEKYALLDSQIKLLTEQKDAVKVEILEDMQKRGAESEKHSLGKFTVTKLKKWIYPGVVKEKEEEVKALKAKFESTGEATYEESDSLRFTSVKL